MTSRKKSLRFNETLEAIEAIVEQLEDDETTLEGSLQAFEQGIALTKAAQQLLAEAEQKVQLLTESAEGEPELEDFDDEDAT